MNTDTTNRKTLDAFLNGSNELMAQKEVHFTNLINIDVEELVTGVSDLVCLPEIYRQINALMDDLDSSLDDFSAVVKTDPALVAAVLKIVNSAFFGFPRQIDNIPRALNLIGTGQLYSLVLSLSAVSSLDLPNEIESLSSFWQRSIFCGVLSQILAKKLKLKDPESLFVIGLLHEVGHLILFLKYPNEFKLIVHQAENENMSLIEAERISFGTDFSEIGSALMAEWNIPEKFQIIIGAQLDPSSATDYVSESYIINIAHKLATNTLPGVDHFQYQIDQGILAELKISQEELDALCDETNEIRTELAKTILGH